jgi:hypothetical protein
MDGINIAQYWRLDIENSEESLVFLYGNTQCPISNIQSESLASLGETAFLAHSPLVHGLTRATL